MTLFADQIVSSGGVAIDSVVSSGRVTVSAGGAASGIHASRGDIFVLSGGLTSGGFL